MMKSADPVEATALPETYHPVHQYEMFEVVVHGPASGNPWLEQNIRASFRFGHRTVDVNGFYDGGGVYKVRWMPDTPGLWTFNLSCSFQPTPQQSAFECLPMRAGVHGPVGVARRHHFAHADGTPYFPFGTTCYAWTHQGEALEQQTLATLKVSPFNKVRMCVFPKSYEYNSNEPEFYPFARPAGTPLQSAGDTTRFDPVFWAHLERLIADLQALGIQADLILFHPYDRWGFASMSAADDDRYVRYAVARLASFSNVWWSLANEFDLMKSKTTQDFTRLLHLVQSEDPSEHLRSIHYSRTMYDYASPAVTHASMQTAAFEDAPQWLESWEKPIVFDEVMYEGNLDRRWGNLSGEEMLRRVWLGVMAGCYVTHGETYFAPGDVIWWAKGGLLAGSSAPRIGFLRHLLQAAAPHGLEAATNAYYLHATTADKPPSAAGPRAILHYFDFHQPLEYEVPLGAGVYRAAQIDPWAMTSTLLPGTYTGKARVPLTGRPGQALLLTWSHRKGA